MFITGGPVKKLCARGRGGGMIEPQNASEAAVENLVLIE